MVQDFGSALATPEASRATDAHGAAPGHVTDVADAAQAYVQADMTGAPSRCVSSPRPASRQSGQEGAAC
eukprot:9790483-Lingulodinium_polyedra.AAC.1